jgi:hypothetical protein
MGIAVVYFFLIPWYESGIESPHSISKPGTFLQECTSTPDTAPPGNVNILNAGQALESIRLTSPNGRYTFGLQPSGQLSLWDKYTRSEVFVSNTAFHWPVTYSVVLSPTGVLELTWENKNEKPYNGLPWMSSMLADCDGMDPKTLKRDMVPPVLELFDSGLLQIRSGHRAICNLHRDAHDHGRLAIVYTGYLRTYLQTCSDHASKLIKPWEGSGGVDIHIYSYTEQVYHPNVDYPTKGEIEDELRKCFGPNLKTVTLVKWEDVREHWNDASKEVLGQSCEQHTLKLDRHLNQYKTIWAAGRQVKRYMMKEGVEYDYILKTRLDLLLHGNIPPLSELVKMAEDGSIVAPRVALDRNWYTMLHNGELIAGVTDIMAFGKATSMYTYLNLYEGWKEMITLEREEGAAKWVGFITHGFEKHGGGRRDMCSPEESLAYWLGLHKIGVKTEWRFEMGLLRNLDGAAPRLGNKLGHVVFTCPQAGRKWLCPVW